MYGPGGRISEGGGEDDHSIVWPSPGTGSNHSEPIFHSSRTCTSYIQGGDDVPGKKLRATGCVLIWKLLTWPQNKDGGKEMPHRRQARLSDELSSPSPLSGGSDSATSRPFTCINCISNKIGT